MNELKQESSGWRGALSRWRGPEAQSWWTARDAKQVRSHRHRELARAALGLGCAAALVGGLSGCDVAVYPTTSEYAAQEAARAAVDVDAESMPATADVLDVEVTLDTVALHRPHDGRWVLLSGDEATTTLVAEPRDRTLADVPMRMQAYDQIAFGITRVRVATEDGWHEATLMVDDVEIDGAFVVDGDVTVSLGFDLQAGLRGDARSGFTFEPLVTATVQSQS